ncbi:LysR family transcriptional regulator [Pseudooceanicola sp. HF7]|uniref:LysR family transcriptional regulator n=1 Tax=Pseudooceanicola sp. HF7 TaxID=2721560 RepID=UPI00142F3D70|nr:LysR family transcriptional regulator [Pseudooceanicola sp. HF7]NIZ11631.1 LysR family transcriptional regulator [Pseudooceanicola sp. HF7]
MDKRLASLDWSLLQVFVAVAETGSLSAAARALGLSQPTLGRQVKKLETALGAELFQRQPRGLSLTATGQEILPAASRMRAALGEIALTVAGQDDRMAGTVRITASNMVACHILPPILAEIRAELPQLQLDLVASDRAESLAFREADIALRMFRPEQLDIVTRKLGEVHIGAFAARSYLDRVGRPASLQDLLALDLIGYDRSELILRAMRALGLTLGRQDFALRCDDPVTYWQLVRAGCGVGFGQRAIGLSDPTLEELETDLRIPPLPVWLSAHESLRRTPRVSHVWDRLATGLAPFVS